jgi:hypothetical protein
LALQDINFCLQALHCHVVSLLQLCWLLSGFLALMHGFFSVQDTTSLSRPGLLAFGPLQG